MNNIMLNPAFPGALNTPELFDALCHILPFAENDFIIKIVYGTTKKFVGSLECTLINKNSLEKFTSDYLKLNNETLRLRNKNTCGPKSSFSIYEVYRCHQNTRNPKTRHVGSILEEKL